MMEIQLKVQKPLKDLVYLELKHKILTGEIVSQTRLMEIDLSEKMNVSRTPIREAIKRLADDGLVKVEPRRGAYVANISIKDMLDVFEVREDMEGFAAKLAAERINEEEKLELANDDFTAIAERVLAGLGGKDNIVEVDYCATRLRTEIKDYTLVDEKAIKNAGVAGVVRPSKTAVQVIVGPKVQFVHDELKKLL